MQANLLPPVQTAFLRGQRDVCTKPRPRDSLARHGDNSEPPPPVFVGPAQWEEAIAKLTPHATPEGDVPLREDIAPEKWHPTPREYEHARQMREGGPPKQLRAA